MMTLKEQLAMKTQRIENIKETLRFTKSNPREDLMKDEDDTAEDEENHDILHHDGEDVHKPHSNSDEFKSDSDN